MTSKRIRTPSAASRAAMVFTRYSLFDGADEPRSIKRTRNAADSKARDLIVVRHQSGDGNGSTPYDECESQRDEGDCEIERHRRPCRITDNVHQDGQTKLAAAQPNKTGQAANRNAPSKRLLKIGTVDSRLHPLFSQFVFQDLNIDASARTTGRQLAVDYDCRNGSNAEPLGAREVPSVLHVAYDDFERRTGLSPHYVNYLMAERASRAEHFHLALVKHSTLRASAKSLRCYRGR